ncbi:alanine/glycine:cation symporter family protein [Propionivibrio dicarboxylicus]|uniref:Alanine or glycine:cation symporter, AGCS family n=1 Tax=Propionivibrio dicarboxylicus TaxID=83767 RepID=A0A1G7UZB9_9RHOO|nr:alanine/glycine:cation symporter family protein [Propionivibrio dicarboxylicus]SDG52648.1 alanine or glycine:cation symporter, AGCS family [Propionivibrio dicarboxylicus]
MNLLSMSAAVDDFFWSQVMVYGCLLAGVYFSLRMRFPQIRLIRDMVGQLFSGKSSASGVSSFQGFAMALGGRVGTGNITGVASAIFFGGPGAVFWMWAIAFLGAGSAYIESALSQVWKERVNGEYRGGPAYYMEKGLKSRPLGIAFAVLTVFGCGLALPGIQSNAFGQAAAHSLSLSPLISGILYTVAVAYVVLGGGRRIAKTAEMVVPFMAIAYILLATIILFVHADRIGEILALIFSCAFNANAAYGAVFGLAIQWGVKRGIFSNEAGQGTGAQASGAAEVSHPAKQGLVQAFSVYVDTLFVCTATAVMILSTNAFNVADPAKQGGLLMQFLPGIEKSNFTQEAVESVLPGFGGIFVAIALFFFTFTTVLAYAFYSDSSIAYLFKRNTTGAGYRYGILLTRIAVIFATFVGAISSVDVVWNFGSAAVGAMAWFNIVVIVLLAKPGIATLRDYEQQRKLGLDPVFVPSRCGIEGAELWDSIVQEHYAKELAALEASESVRDEDEDPDGMKRAAVEVA